LLPAIAVPLAAASVAAQVVSVVQSETLARQATPRGEMVRLLAGARAEILEPSRWKRFLVA
jgi:hypothetical protein